MPVDELIVRMRFELFGDRELILKSLEFSCRHFKVVKTDSCCIDHMIPDSHKLNAITIMSDECKLRSFQIRQKRKKM